MKLRRCKSLEKRLESELSALDKLKEEIERKDEEINELLELRKSLKSRKIVWAFSRKSDYKMLEDLRNDGFKAIHEWDLEEPSSKPLKEECDVMIYSFLSEENSLNEIISFLRSKERKVPLVVYTYDKNLQVKIPNEQFDILNEYRNYSISNTPGNFKSLFNGLVLGLTI
jgi:hypothetical protein